MPYTGYIKDEIDTVVSSINADISASEEKIIAMQKQIDELLQKPPVTPPVSNVTTGLYNPLYIYPTNPVWQTVINTKKANPNLPFLVTINPASGVGAAKDQNWTNLVASLKLNGIIVIGYVYTSYGGRAIANCKAEIDAYKNWYNCDGIFYDEMNNKAGGSQYYKDLTAYTKSKGMSYTMGNPGADTAAEYVGSCNTIIIYERQGLPSIDSLKGWHLNYDKKNFSIIPHSVPTLDNAFVDEAKKYVGWIYITNDVMPNPWDSLTSYYNQLVTRLAA